MARDAFEDDDEPVNSDMEPEEALKLDMGAPEAPAEDVIGPVLDE
jgi:hypothetical protein